jgi:hypothetical protein
MDGVFGNTNLQERDASGGTANAKPGTPGQLVAAGKHTAPIYVSSS